VAIVVSRDDGTAVDQFSAGIRLRESAVDEWSMYVRYGLMASRRKKSEKDTYRK
jgi:hypothetical protein